MTQVVLCFLTFREGPWIIRVDSKHGNEPHHQRHIHITRKRLGGEYSWNEDGTRHDKHKFPTSENSIQAAKEIAAKRLGINPAMLQFMTPISGASEISVLGLLPHYKDEVLMAILAIDGNDEMLVFTYSDGVVFVSSKKA